MHKIKMVFVRQKENSLPILTDEKLYGSWGEDCCALEIKEKLQNCKIKKNVIINSAIGKAEIDFLVFYNDKLFAIEVKNWKGDINELEDGDFLQEKYDCNQKVHKSPFKQLERAIFLLKKQQRHKVWINDIILFLGADEVNVQTDKNWFDSVEEMIEYMKTSGEESNEMEARLFLDECTSSDIIYGKEYYKKLYCNVSDQSLIFQTERGVVTRKDISTIDISHHLTYDELDILLKDGSVQKVVEENQKIFVKEGDGSVGEYALCKLDYIQLGDYI